MREPLGEGQIAYVIDQAKHLVVVNMLGPVTPAQIEDFMMGIESNPEYSVGFDGLIDLREFTGGFETEDLKQIAQRVRTRPGAAGARRAIIVRDDLQFGMMRMLEGFTFLAPVIYHAFRSEEAALKWLQERRPLVSPPVDDQSRAGVP